LRMRVALLFHDLPKAKGKGEKRKGDRNETSESKRYQSVRKNSGGEKVRDKK